MDLLTHCLGCFLLLCPFAPSALTFDPSLRLFGTWYYGCLRVVDCDHIHFVSGHIFHLYNSGRKFKDLLCTNIHTKCCLYFTSRVGSTKWTSFAHRQLLLFRPRVFPRALASGAACTPWCTCGFRSGSVARALGVSKSRNLATNRREAFRRAKNQAGRWKPHNF